MKEKKIIIAIDGFSSSGKSTMAKQLAKEVGYVYVDSGAMYRVVTLYAILNGMVSVEGGLNVDSLVKVLPEIKISFSVMPDGSQHTLLNGEDVEKEIRSLEVSAWVSPVAEIPEIRRRLTEIQRSYGRERGIVMDGRDIGTTVFPDAEMKVFVNASAEVRAMRRFKELQEKGDEVSYEEVLANIRERDRIDSTRKESPLRKSADAFELDNDNLTREQQLDILIDLFKERTK